MSNYNFFNTAALEKTETNLPESLKLKGGAIEAHGGLTVDAQLTGVTLDSNSQHDIAVLLPRVSKNSDAQPISQFWMREAARQQHVYAKQKATKDPEPEIDIQCAATMAKEAARAKVKQIL